MTRQCARPDCAEQATSTFGYDYRAGTVWLVDLADEPDPSTYDLCRRHANALSVPRGWELRDRRTLVPTLVREAS
jgi:hypothetical protein